MDKSTRNDIQSATQAARKLLEDAYREQLEGTYDILVDGTITEQAGSHLSDWQKVTRSKLLAAVAHKRSTVLKAKEAVDAYLREAAFTTLNRFVALKMLEARQLVQECVSKGEDSSGFKEFTALAPGLVSVEDKGYRLYIETLFDEIGQEVKALFDRRDVASLLWPDRQTLLELLTILNEPQLSSVWAEDETIGWVYQYFNGDEERSKMREESQSPRNSRELAVRNQFFTPRYVVQFLTDNTLGRTWCEMMQGDTQLAHLDYLVRRPNEVFLAEGELEPESDTDGSELSQEELLQQTVHVPFRKKKDSRDLRILDPACGSGHFLLYTFDLLITIYEEAWADARAAAFTETGTQLRADYESLEDLRRAMPELILRHNLHGVDIDPRAAQIAALALWMRAQRAYNQFEVDRAHRPPITKTHIVVAEPMPGDAELVDEFAASLKPAVLGDLFKKMVEEMKLAGELGSLLKIEVSIAKAVKEAAESSQQGNLFTGKVESNDFWATADEKIIAALGSFAESAGGAGGVRRQLFAEDAAQGVAFIELMRKRFDAVLMNPPFGKYIDGQFSLLQRLYPKSKRDLGIAFVERGRAQMSPSGMVGALFSRKPFYIQSTLSWRATVIEGRDIRVFADLGLGVLDDALVEVAATVFGRGQTTFQAIGALDTPEKEKRVRVTAQGQNGGPSIVSFKELEALPGMPFVYGLPHHLLSCFGRNRALEPEYALPRIGLQTSDDFRFLRLAWELPASELTEARWLPLSKGGEYAQFYSPNDLCVLWERGRGQMAAYSLHGGNEARSRQGSSFYLQPALTYTERTASRFSARVLELGALFSVAGPGIVPVSSSIDAWTLCGVVNSWVWNSLIETCVGGGDSVSSGTAARHYTAGLLGTVPFPALRTQKQSIGEASRKAYTLQKSVAAEDETSAYFCHPPGLSMDASTISEMAAAVVEHRLQTSLRLIQLSWEIEQQVCESFGITPDQKHHPDVGIHPGALSSDPADVAKIEDALGEEDVDEASLVAFAQSELGSARHVVVKSYAADRSLELAAQALATHPRNLRMWQGLKSSRIKLAVTNVAQEILSFMVGRVFGRWLSGALSVAPTMDSDLSGSTNWPIARVVDASGADGPEILVTDEGHSEDLATLVLKQAVADPISIDDLERCLGGSAPNYIRQHFFDYHLGKYSKHRRKAPIYWQLATSSASYSVWCYYHRLTHDTFFRVANDYATPKVDHEERKLNTLRQEAGADPSSKQRKEIDAQETFVAELRAFLTEVKRIAPLWNPNLNDGVIINFAPLWRLVPQNKSWQKECKKVWDKLVKGDYDWAHLAMHLWPERVVPKCQNDRSLAIAHGLEDDFWYEDDDDKWQKRQVGGGRVEDLVAERASTAVKTALEDLLNAPVPGGQTRRKRRASV